MNSIQTKTKLVMVYTHRREVPLIYIGPFIRDLRGLWIYIRVMLIEMDIHFTRENLQRNTAH